MPSLCQRGNSRPGVFPLVLRILIHVRSWKNLEDPPQWVFLQHVANGLTDILDILITNSPRPVLAAFYSRQGRNLVLSNSGRDVPSGECIPVEQNLAVCAHDLLDHPTKWNIGECVFCCVQRDTTTDIYVSSTCRSKNPAECSTTHQNDNQQTIPLSCLS
jgi:hypothetical protein